MGFLINWNVCNIDSIDINFLENRMSLSHLVSRIGNLLLEVGWSLLIGKNTWIDWNNSPLDNIIKALLKKIQWNCRAYWKWTILLWNNWLYYRAIFNRFLFVSSHLKVAERRGLLFIFFLIHWKTTEWRSLFLFRLFVHFETTKRRLLFSWFFLILLRISHFKSSKWSSCTFTKGRFFRFICLSFNRILSSHFKRAKSRNTWSLILFFGIWLNLFNSWFITSKSLIDSIACLYFLLIIICLHWSLHEMFHCFLQTWI